MFFSCRVAELQRRVLPCSVLLVWPRARIDVCLRSIPVVTGAGEKQCMSAQHAHLHNGGRLQPFWLRACAISALRARILLRRHCSSCKTAQRDELGLRIPVHRSSTCSCASLKMSLSPPGACPCHRRAGEVTIAALIMMRMGEPPCLPPRSLALAAPRICLGHCSGPRHRKLIESLGVGQAAQF